MKKVKCVLFYYESAGIAAAAIRLLPCRLAATGLAGYKDKCTPFVDIYTGYVV